MTYTLLLIAALVFAAAGWLAFGLQYRAHRATRAELAGETARRNYMRANLGREIAYLRDELIRKTDRDPATGRFWCKPGEA